MGSIPVVDPEPGAPSQPETGPKTGDTARPGGTPRRRRRWKRWLLIAPLLLIALVLGLLQTPAAAWFVEPIMAAQTGLRVETGSVRVSPGGTVTITGARFSAPDIPGVPGEILVVDRIRARIDWRATLTGSPGLSHLMLTGPVLRFSQDADTGVLNAAAFKPIRGGGAGRTPSVSVRRGTIELGEHRDARYSQLRRWSVVGEVDPADSAGVSAFDFAAVPAEAAAGGSPSGSLGLTGTVGPHGLRARLDGLRLEDWPPSIVPSRLREVYARLDLAGRLLPTEFAVSTDGEVTVRMTLDGVDLNLPFDEDYELAGTGELLRMRQTRGTIEFNPDGFGAEISGLIDELRYDVDLRWLGFAVDAPFKTELTTRFRMDDRFRPRRFLPERAVSKLDMFESPAGDVEARLHIARAAPGGRITLDGRAEVTNGSASYGGFRYPFRDMTATVVFSQDHLVIERVEGRGPSGAVLRGVGTFDGLDDLSRVAIDLTVSGVPIDRHLMDALTPGRRRLVEALFHPGRYRELLAEGLVRTPEGEGGPDAPLFRFGGAADVVLELRRVPDRPEDDRWVRETLVRLDHAGLVPEHFPLPIVARGVELRITDEELSLTGGRYEGLTGGQASVSAALDQSAARPGMDALPIVEITARGIPIDERLLAAIPGYRDPPGPGQPVSLRSILDNLRIAGTVECHAEIGPRPDGQLGFDVEAWMRGATARPNASVPGVPAPSPDEPDPLVLAGMTGVVYVTERMIVVRFQGDLQSPARPLAPTPITLLTQLTLPERRGGLGDVARTGGLLPIQQGPPLPGPILFAETRATGLDLAMPLEHAAAVVSPELAERLAELRSQRNPDGIVSMRAEIEGIVGGHTETLLAVDQVRSFAFDHEGVRHKVGASEGWMELMLGIHPRASFSGFSVPLTSGQVESGRLRLDGWAPLVRPGADRPGSSGGRLTAELSGGRIESPATRQVIGAFGGGAVRGWLDERQVSGSFELALDLTPLADAPPVRLDPNGYALPAFAARGVLRPGSIGIELPGSRIAFDTVEGAVRFDGRSGRIDGLHAEAEGLSVRADGPWSYTPGRGAGFDLLLDASGRDFGPTLRALLPQALRDAADRFQIGVLGPLRAEDLRLAGKGLGTEQPTVRVSGLAEVSGAEAVIGVPITDLSGRVRFEAEAVGDRVGYAIDLDADRLRAGRLRIENAGAVILADASRPGAVLIPEITGRMHGGRVAGSAQVHAVGEETRYWVDLHASDVRAAPVFDDLLLPPEGLVGPPLPGEDAVRSAWAVAEDMVWTVADDYTRGLLHADISLSGVADRPEATTGRGVVRVGGGSVIALPGLINLIEVSNLRAPVGARLDLAEAVFYIDGTTMAFERLSAGSRSIEIIGHGTMNWVTQDLDLRFRSRSIRPVPVFSRVLEQIRDELITTRMTGRPGNLDFSTETFGSTRQLVRALLGEPETEQERVMSSVEQASRAAKNRDPRRETPPVMPAAEPAAWAEHHD
ncbi:MAG: hypothetical protein LAT64_12065 [Phycisphaerales bacterium]|nr:hypothetical protein [Planctomycetota bacterium]MCH8509488.1 hypothetical protein [Phycisphaerales bacterium]